MARSDRTGSVVARGRWREYPAGEEEFAVRNRLPVFVVDGRCHLGESRRVEVVPGR
jgi:hypothetical protein